MPAKAPRRMKHRHEEVLMWILLNPHKTQRELARDLGYTEAWLSTLINTDMFQERLKALRDTYHSTAFVGVRSKAEAAATLALDRLTEVLENDVEHDLSPSFILEATTKLLSHVGGLSDPRQAPGSGGVTVNVGIAQEIATAMQHVRQAQSQLPPIEEPARSPDSLEETSEAPVLEPAS